MARPAAIRGKAQVCCQDGKLSIDETVELMVAVLAAGVGSCSVASWRCTCCQAAELTNLRLLLA